MAQYRTCVAAGILLLAVLAAAQPYIPNPSSGSVYAGPSGIQSFYTGPSGANTPVVVIGASAYVGTNMGVVGGTVFGSASASPMNNPPINRTTMYPVTALWNTSMTVMVAVANDTLMAFTGNVSLWNFTSPGFQLDFASTMPGQYPTPLVWNNTIFIGSRNANWISGSASGWSWVYAIDLATGTQKWRVSVAGSYTNYPIQLGSDLQTLVVRASTPLVYTTVYLLNGATGMILPFLATTRYTGVSTWLPQLALYNGTLWINDYCGYIDVVNTTTNVSTNLRSMGCTSSGFPPIMLGNVMYVVASSSVYAFGAFNFSTLTASAGSAGTIEQVLQYTATSYIFGGTNGLQTYSTATNSFVSASSSSNAFFSPYYTSDCQSLSWAGGLLVASFGVNVYGINVTAGTVAWQNQDNVNGVGQILLVPTANGNVFVMANGGTMSSTSNVYTSLLTWAQPAGSGWITAYGLNPSGFAYFGAPYNVVVVQSASNNAVTVLGAFNGSTLLTYTGTTIYSSDATPVQVGDFACSNGYNYIYCVPLVSGKTSFRVAQTSSSSSTYPLTISGSVLYRTGYYGTIESLDTSATTPALTTVTIPSTTGSGSISYLKGAVSLGKNAAGQAMLFGAGNYHLFGIKIAAAATSWITYTLATSLIGDPLYGSYFTTNVVQVPGDSNILVGGSKPPTVTIGSSGGTTKYGILKFGATSHTYVDTYTFPSVTATPAWLEVGPSVVIIVGTSNLTACDQNGNRYWSVALGSVLITSTNLQAGTGALFVAAYGTGSSSLGTVWYTINAYTGAILWTSSQYYSSSSAIAATSVNGLVFWGQGRVMVANLVTGQMVGNFAVASSSGTGLTAQGGNSTTAAWAYSASYSYVYGVPINNSFVPAASQRSITGSFSPASPSSADEEAEKSKLWIIAVVVAFLLVVIVIAVVVSRKKGPPKDQDYVAMNSQAGSV